MSRILASAVSIAAVSIASVAQGQSSTSCVSRLLERAGSSGTFSGAELSRLETIEAKFEAMETSIAVLAANTASWNADFSVVSFQRFRRDELFYASAYLCLKNPDQP